MCVLHYGVQKTPKIILEHLHYSLVLMLLHFRFFLSSPPRPNRLWGPPSLLFRRGIKWPEREVNNPPPFSAEVKNMCSFHSTPPYIYTVRLLVKHRDNFTFFLPFTPELKLIEIPSVCYYRPYMGTDGHNRPINVYILCVSCNECVIKQGLGRVKENCV
jgi:hypothetical protein